MKVDDIMSPHPICIGADASLDEAMDLMDQHSIRHLLVMDGGELVGVLGERDLLQATGWLPPGLREALEAPEGCVRDFMKTPVLSVDLGDGLARAAGMLVDFGVGCLPVLRSGELAGLVSERDLLRAYVAGREEGRIDAGDDPPLSEVMTEAPTVAAPDQLLEDAVDSMRAAEVRHLPVVEDERLVGMLSDRDLRRAVGEGRYGGTPVSAVMSRDPVVIAPDQRLSDAARLMLGERVSSLLVTRSRELLGILTTSDVLGTCAVALQNALAREGKGRRKS
jgi:CBS domain-containing protein